MDDQYKNFISKFGTYLKSLNLDIGNYKYEIKVTVDENLNNKKVFSFTAEKLVKDN